MAILTNLISHWRCDEESGNLVDVHGGLDLTDNNTVGATTGKVAGARQFVAANSEYFSRADNASHSVGDIDFTWALWVMLDDKSTFRVQFAKMKDPLADEGDIEYELFYDVASDRFLFRLGNTTSSSTAVSANNLGSPSTATWYFFVCWHDASANTVNIQANNGTVDSVSWANGSQDSNGELRIGAQQITGAESYHDGRLDSISFWKRVLTSDERTLLWNNGSGLDYPFNVGTPEALAFPRRIRLRPRPFARGRAR